MASWDDFPAVATAPQEGWDKFPKVEDDPWSKFPAADAPPPKPESPTPASDKALAETPVSPASTFSFKTPQQMDVADQKMIAPYLADAATGVAQGVKEMVPKSVGSAAKMLFYTPIEETPHAIKEAYDVIRGVPIAEAVPESQTYKGFTQKSLTEQAKIVTGQVVPLALGLTGLRESLRPTVGGELNAIERSNAQVQARETPFGVETRPEGEVPKPSDSDNVVRETQGTQQPIVAEPPQETPQPVKTWNIRGDDISTGDPVKWMSGGTWDGIVQDAIKKPTGTHDVLVNAIDGTTFWLKDAEHYGMSKGKSKFAPEGWGEPVPEAGQAPVVSGGKPTVGADVGAVPPTEANEPHVSAIANRFVEERAARGELGRITPGRGFSREDLVQGGLTMPPEVINQHVSDLMQGTGDIVKQGQAVRAEEARLSARSNQLSRVAESNPQNMEAKMAADNAFKDLEDFHNGPVATLKQKWHATGLEMQGEIPVDLSTFNGLRQQWLRDVGEAPPAKVEPELRRAAQNVSKAIVEDNGARSKLAQAIDKESTRRKYPSADEVRNNIRERMGLEPCRT